MENNEKTNAELFVELKQLWEEFEREHTVFEVKGVKAAAARARKHLGAIKKLVTDYRKTSIDETRK